MATISKMRGILVGLLVLVQHASAQDQCGANPCNSGTCAAEEATTDGYLCTCDMGTGTTGDAWKAIMQGKHCDVGEYGGT